MHHFLKNLAVVGAMGIFALSNASAATVLWNGGDRPSTAYDPVLSPYGTSGGSYTEGGGGFGAVFSDDDPSAGFMRQLDPGVAGGTSNFSLDSAATHIDRAAGWSLEIRLDSTNEAFGYGMYGFVRDSVGATYLVFTNDNIYVQNGDAITQITEPISSGFHSYYLSMAPGGTNVDFYLDGVLKGSTPMNLGAGASSVQFGDGDSGHNGSGIWDYVYVNGPAVPEPATLGLAAIAALGLLRRR